MKIITDTSLIQIFKRKMFTKCSSVRKILIELRQFNHNANLSRVYECLPIHINCILEETGSDTNHIIS